MFTWSRRSRAPPEVLLLPNERPPVEKAERDWLVIAFAAGVVVVLGLAGVLTVMSLNLNDTNDEVVLPQTNAAAVEVERVPSSPPSVQSPTATADSKDAGESEPEVGGEPPEACRVFKTDRNKGAEEAWQTRAGGPRARRNPKTKSDLKPWGQETRRE